MPLQVGSDRRQYRREIDISARFPWKNREACPLAGSGRIVPMTPFRRDPVSHAIFKI
jgi:hypothetical protein